MKRLLLAISIIISTFGSGIAQIDTNVVVYSWELDESLANRNRIVVDTALDNFQQYNPVFRQFTSVQTLGNYGLPAQSAVFTERPLNAEFLPMNVFSPFMKQFQTTAFYNCKRPFTKLSYLNGGSYESKVEILDALHTQNITKTLNVGLHYTTVAALGQYQFQKVKNTSFRAFSSLSTKYYSYHISVNYNKILADENGGVINDSLITDSTFSRTKDIPMLFSGYDSPPTHEPDVLNEIKNLNILAVQEISFRLNRKSTDTTAATKKLKIFYPKLVYIFTLNRSVRRFTDKQPQVGMEHGLYSNAYVSDELARDSLFNWKMSNVARLQFQGKRNNHYFIDYAYDFNHYSMVVKPDTIINDSVAQYHFLTQEYSLPGLSYSSDIYNASVSSGFSKIFAKRLDVNLYGRYYLSGYLAGDFLLSADMRMDFGNLNMPVSLYVKAENALKSPDYLYAHYASNYFIWTNNFLKTSLSHLSTNLTISSKKFDIQGDYYLLSNLIYMNEEAVPAQYGNALSVFVLSASKKFEFWKLTSMNKLIYQQSENENVLDLPNVAFYNSTYLKHLFNFRSTGGKLLAMIGFDLFYNTKYYADAYMPSLNAFHRQQEKQLGNYPYIDVFLNLQLKRFRFFMKAEHLNSGWMGKNYFSVLHYPRNEFEIKLGISWTFYD